MACLDTSACIDLIRSPRSVRGKAARAMVQRLVAEGETLTTTRLCQAELASGVFRSRDPDTELRKVEELLTSCVVLELDADAAMIFGRLHAKLRRQGRVVSDFDLMIAAISLRHDEPVVTANPSHFRRVAGLRVLAYTVPAKG